MMCWSFMESSLKIDSDLKSQCRDLESREMDPTAFLCFFVWSRTHTLHPFPLAQSLYCCRNLNPFRNSVCSALLLWLSVSLSESFEFGLLVKIPPAGLFYNSFNSNVTLNKLYSICLLTRNIHKSNKDKLSCSVMKQNILAIKIGVKCLLNVANIHALFIHISLFYCKMAIFVKTSLSIGIFVLK